MGRDLVKARVDVIATVGDLAIRTAQEATKTIPILAATDARLGVTLQVLHGFNSATCMWNASQNGNDDRPLVVLYVGDYDPSGMWMSEEDIPTRLTKYGGHHIEFRRIALTAPHTSSLRSFPASDKRKDPRYKWFVKNYGEQCWELDAMDPRHLRDLVETEIKALIDPVLWAQQEVKQEQERRALDLHMKFLQQEGRERQAVETVLRHLKIYQSLNPVTTRYDGRHAV